MLKVLLIAISVCGSYCNAQACLQTVFPVNYLAFPTAYNSVSVINNETADCLLFHNSHFQCAYTVILGDEVMVPSPPDLTSSTYLRHFLAWQRGSSSLYVDFALTRTTSGVTAIELSFLNSPANRISLPDITLSRVQDGNPNPIPSRILSNQDLTQIDNQIRTVIVRPLISQASLNLRINFVFTDFHDFDWIFLSEVRFCTNPQSLFTPNIVFLAPVSSIVQPSVNDLRRGSTELVCTVSSEGSYTWQWERDNSVIGNNEDFRVTIGDGSRTTRLTISNLDFSDAGEYSCTATTKPNGISTQFIVQTLQFFEHISSTVATINTVNIIIAATVPGMFIIFELVMIVIVIFSIIKLYQKTVKSRANQTASNEIPTYDRPVHSSPPQPLLTNEIQMEANSAYARP